MGGAEEKSLYCKDFNSGEIGDNRNVDESVDPIDSSNSIKGGETAKDGADRDILDETADSKNPANKNLNVSSSFSKIRKNKSTRLSGYTNWTIKEEDYLINSAGMMSDEEVAEKLTKLSGRLVTKTSVRRKRQRMGLAKTGGRGVKALDDKARKSKYAPKESALKHHKNHFREMGLHTNAKFKEKKTIETDIEKLKIDMMIEAGKKKLKDKKDKKKEE